MIVTRFTSEEVLVIVKYLKVLAEGVPGGHIELRFVPVQGPIPEQPSRLSVSLELIEKVYPHPPWNDIPVIIQGACTGEDK